MSAVEYDVSAWLRQVLANPPASLTMSNCKAGPVRKVTESSIVAGAVPDRCVFVLPTGGFQGVAFVDGGQRTGEDRPTVQITVRSSVQDYDDGAALADAVAQAIEMNPPPGWFDARLMHSAPTYLGEDEQGHHLHTINVALRRART